MHGPIIPPGIGIPTQPLGDGDGDVLIGVGAGVGVGVGAGVGELPAMLEQPEGKYWLEISGEVHAQTIVPLAQACGKCTLEDNANKLAQISFWFILDTL